MKSRLIFLRHIGNKHNRTNYMSVHDGISAGCAKVAGPIYCRLDKKSPRRSDSLVIRFAWSWIDFRATVCGLKKTKHF